VAVEPVVLLVSGVWEGVSAIFLNPNALVSNVAGPAADVISIIANGDLTVASGAYSQVRVVATP
jgi:hypothetical protein